MNIGEGLPLLLGLGCGSVLHLVSSRHRCVVGGLLALFGGTLAMVANNELTLSWTYLFFDMPLVAISMAFGWALARYRGMLLWRAAQAMRALMGLVRVS